MDIEQQFPETGTESTSTYREKLSEASRRLADTSRWLCTQDLGFDEPALVFDPQVPQDTK